MQAILDEKEELLQSATLNQIPRADLSRRAHLKETLTLAAPVMVGQLGMVLMGLQDNLMVGWVSQVHLSASALGNSIYFILLVLGFGVTYAITPLVSEAVGAGKSLDSAQYLRQGVWVTLITGLVLMGLVEACVWLLPYMGQPPVEAEMAGTYLRIMNVATIPMLMFGAYRQYCDGLNDTRTGMIVTIIGLLANIVLNWMLIFGKWGAPRLELAGAAWGTVGAKLIMMGLIMAYVHYGRAYRQYMLAEGGWAIDWAQVRKLFALGLPVGFQFFFEVAAFGGAAIMMGWLEDPATARAAHTMAMSIASVTFMFASGLAAGASVRVGNYYGMRDSVGMQRAAAAALWLCAAIMAASALLFVLLRYEVPAWYGAENNELAETAAALCIFAACFQIFDGTQVVASAILRGRQDVRFATIAMFVAHWLVSLPLSYVLAFVLGWGVYGFWVSFVVSLALAAGLLTWRVWRLRHVGGETPAEIEAV